MGHVRAAACYALPISDGSGRFHAGSPFAPLVDTRCFHLGHPAAQVIKGCEGGGQSFCFGEICEVFVLHAGSPWLVFVIRLPTTRDTGKTPQKIIIPLISNNYDDFDPGNGASRAPRLPEGSMA